MKQTTRASSLFRAVIALLLLAVALPAQEREPAAGFQARREALRQKLPDGLTVLFGYSDSPGPESLLPFRQENNFYYLTGFNYPGAVLLLAPPADRRSRFHDESLRLPREILFLPKHNPEHDQWTGPMPNPDDPATAAETGFAVVKDVKDLEAELRRYARGFSNLYTLLPDTYSEETESSFARDNVERLKAIVPRLKMRDPRKALGSLRQIKSEGELNFIRKAVDCSLDAHLAAMRGTKPGLYEYQLAALMQYTFAREGCTRPAYGMIVGSGPRSTILHYNQNSERMEAGDVVVIDVGGEYDHYAADITRTLPVNGHFTPRQREIYEIVLGAQKAAIDAVKPGMTLGRRGPNSLFQIALDYLNTHGKDSHGQPLGKYFPHGLGHHVGLYVHDLQAGGPLEPGMVITIEPGVYLPDEKIGVRIEDMVLVTQTGHVLLSERLPREVDDIERLMSSASAAGSARPSGSDSLADSSNTYRNPRFHMQFQYPSSYEVAIKTSRSLGHGLFLVGLRPKDWSPPRDAGLPPDSSYPVRVWVDVMNDEEAAAAMGFAQRDGHWVLLKQQEVAGSAERIVIHGWRGLRGKDPGGPGGVLRAVLSRDANLSVFFEMSPILSETVFDQILSSFRFTK